MDLDGRGARPASPCPCPGQPLQILVASGDLAAPDRDSGALRMYRILELLARDGHEITFIARAGFGRERATALLAGLGIEVFPVDPERLRELGAAVPGAGVDLHRLLAARRFDLALLSFYDVAEQYLPRIRALSPFTRVVVDTVDVHHVRERRGAELSGDPVALAAAERTRAREAAVYGAADALVAVSDQDAGELRLLAPQVPVLVVSNVHAPAPQTPGFEDRSGLVFVGSFPHRPNVDAILHFHRTAWPQIRQRLPGVRLTVIGTEPPPEVQALSAPDVEVTGWVPDVAAHLDRARVSIAPLRYGAGVKGKVGEALGRGLPVVATTIAAEGMDLSDGTHALVADDPAEFAAAVVRVHEQRPLWEQLSSAGRAHIDARLGLEASRGALRALLAQVLLTPFVASASDPGIADTIVAYARTFAAGDPVSLVLSVPEGDQAAAEQALAAAAATLAEHGLAPDAVGDIQIACTSPDPILPARAVSVADHVGDTSDAYRWRKLAAPPAPSRRRRPAARAAILVHALDDHVALSAQIDALCRGGLPDDLDLVIAADAPGPEMESLLSSLSGARIVRGAESLGRHQAWQLAASATDAPLAVALSPLALPGPGFAESLLEPLRSGAALAGPVVDGAAGLLVAADASLWPRALDDPRPPAALALDCLGGARELFAEGLPELPRGEGHVETQLGAWVADRGGLAVVPEATVSRLAAPPASIVVTTRNRAEELPDCIALLLASGARDVVIVDNASTDETAAVAAELAARSDGRVRVAFEERAGNGHARNAGAGVARHDLLLYIDDDARPAPGWETHLAWALSRTGVANAGGPISALWPPERPAGWPGRSLEPLLSVLDLGDRDRLLVPPDIVYGANWAIRRGVLRAIGGFDPSIGYGPGSRIGGNEVSVAWRLHDRGLGSTRYTAGACVGHRISKGRIDEGWMVRRGLSVGVERVVHLRELGQATPERMLAGARGAAAQLLALAPMHGDLTVATAFQLIADGPLELARRVQAAMSLGEMAASVAAMGLDEAAAGDLRLRFDAAAMLRGVIDAPLAVAA